jgi:hypothetical protein
MENTTHLASLRRWLPIVQVCEQTNNRAHVPAHDRRKHGASATKILIVLFTATWDAPPNFLLVDYYNYGDPKPGSVFEVAARYNNVTYNRPCCGSNDNAGVVSRASPMAVCVAAVLLAVFLQQ